MHSGASLALKNGQAVVGAPQENLGTSSIHGAAYFFRQTKKGTFKKVFKTISTDPTTQRFSYPLIRLEDNKAYIADPLYTGTVQNQGSIAVYAFDDCHWKFKGVLVDPNPFLFELVGESFDVQNCKIAVGTGWKSPFPTTNTPFSLFLKLKNSESKKEGFLPSFFFFSIKFSSHKLHFSSE
ncbi:MAG: hypothetical protein LW832_07715 [Parachlamydia sp.]|jgi:hypothetical protein|nr:hypothetical protein [Parachlamydia sp.]